MLFRCTAQRIGWVGLVLLLVALPARGEESPEYLTLPLERLGGAAMQLGDLGGQVVLVNFWATWCPPCKKEIPDLVQAQESYQEQGFTVVGVNFMEKPYPERLQAFVQEHGIIYPVVYADSQVQFKLAQSLGGVFGLPVSIFLDRAGKVVYSHTGAINAAQIAQVVEPLLSVSKGASPENGP